MTGDALVRCFRCGVLYSGAAVTDPLGPEGWRKDLNSVKQMQLNEVFFGRRCVVCQDYPGREPGEYALLCGPLFVPRPVSPAVTPEPSKTTGPGAGGHDV